MRPDGYAAIADDAFNLPGKHSVDIIRNESGDAICSFHTRAKRPPRVHLDGPRPDLREKIAAVEVEKNNRDERESHHDRCEPAAIFNGSFEQPAIPAGESKKASVESLLKTGENPQMML